MSNREFVLLALLAAGAAAFIYYLRRRQSRTELVFARMPVAETPFDLAGARALLAGPSQSAGALLQVRT